MTREELYNLVWSWPMTHLAKEFRISDVAIRKYCKKFDIPTPYVGYWIKLAHDKRVKQPVLSTMKYSADETVDLIPRALVEKPVESIQAAEEVKSRLDKIRPQLVVPDKLYGMSHPLVQHTKARLKQAKPDNYGLLSIGSSYRPSISIGNASIQRVLRILSTLRKVADREGHSLFEEEGRYYWQVNDERIAVRIYETKDKDPHVPTKAELRDQAGRDEWRKEHPDWYATDRKAYRLWDYRPSGRLTFELSEVKHYGWGDEQVHHGWRDRKTKTLEQCLPDIFVWLASAEVIIREKRLRHEEKQRFEAAAREKRQILKERSQKAIELERLILEFSEAQQNAKNIRELLKAMADRQEDGSWATRRLFEELQSYQKHLQSMTDEPAISASLNSLKIDQETPLLIPYLTAVEIVDE